MNRHEPPPAACGGSRGYNNEHRSDALALDARGLGHLTTPHERTMERWRAPGGRARKRQRGGPQAANLRGEDQFLLVLYRTGYPKATADEIAAFIATNSSTGRIYSRQDISKREGELGLTRKAASTTARQAETPVNLVKYDMFWTMPFPYGVAGTPRARLLDSDEAAFSLDKANRRFGKAPTWQRVREVGPYHQGDKWTLILAISPCGRKWFQISRMTGTTTSVYAAFMAKIVKDPALGVVGTPGFVPRTFMHDNLNSHLGDEVTQTINRAGHKVQQRVPYNPNDAPIEYQFNHIESEMGLRVHKIHTDRDLVREITAIITNMGAGFDAAFTHCGYA
jgi:hypothetical protein